ncbi:MAG TPA: MmcQ/YjbR family DNA-binding protein [Acidothermaceae bacterium]|nr:MmcQ/YjbR family DNA-binding protein [Acidothermaceae bacterium]
MSRHPSPSRDRVRDNDVVHDTGLDVAQLARVRACCLALPGVNERASHQTPTFFVNDKRSFAQYWVNHHGDGRLALWCAAHPGAQEAYVADDPESFFVPPYVGHLGWLGVRLDRALPWSEIEAVLLEAYRKVAPKRLLAELESLPTRLSRE